MQSALDGHDTPASAPANAPGGRDEGCVLQLPPFHASMSGSSWPVKFVSS